MESLQLTGRGTHLRPRLALGPKVPSACLGGTRRPDKIASRKDMFAIHILVEAGAVTLVTNRVVQLCISPRRLQLGEYPETLQSCGLIRICCVVLSTFVLYD